MHVDKSDLEIFRAFIHDELRPLLRLAERTDERLSELESRVASHSDAFVHLKSTAQGALGVASTASASASQTDLKVASTQGALHNIVHELAEARASQDTLMREFRDHVADEVAMRSAIVNSSHSLQTQVKNEGLKQKIIVAIIFPLVVAIGEGIREWRGGKQVNQQAVPALVK